MKSTTTSRNRDDHYTNFQKIKEHCLSTTKRDKSSAGQIDPRVIDICNAINKRNEYYTTSSCSGRSFIYTGIGNKADTIYTSTTTSASASAQREEQVYHDGITTTSMMTTTTIKTSSSSSSSCFRRFRVSHDRIEDPDRYFDLNTLPMMSSINTADAGVSSNHDDEQDDDDNNHHDDDKKVDDAVNRRNGGINDTNKTQQQQQDHHHQDVTSSLLPWLRYEPFILHVACRSLDAASVLMNAARPSFKNVGLTSWRNKKQKQKGNNNNNKNSCPRYIVAIWGDEGLDMPLMTPPSSAWCGDDDDTKTTNFPFQLLHSSRRRRHDSAVDQHHHHHFVATWLAGLVNERHERNWAKMNRFLQAIRDLPQQHDVDDLLAKEGEENGDNDDYGDADDNCDSDDEGNHGTDQQVAGVKLPRSYDVIGDVALIHSVPSDDGNNNHGAKQSQQQEQQLKEIGNAIMKKNGGIRIVAIRTSSLVGIHRSVAESDDDNGDGIQIIAGDQNRVPLITTHCEHGIKCVVDIRHTFFTPRMNTERSRICNCINNNKYSNNNQEQEDVLVLFAGVCMEVFQIIGRCTRVRSITAIETNQIAIECAHRGLRMLRRNVKGVFVPVNNVADRVHIIHDDVLNWLPKQPRIRKQLQSQQQQVAQKNDDNCDHDHHHIDYYHRILAPRPKANTSEQDGDLGDGTGALPFLRAILPMMKRHHIAVAPVAVGDDHDPYDIPSTTTPNNVVFGTICHWYDFVADHEYPQCHRIIDQIRLVCREMVEDDNTEKEQMLCDNGTTSTSSDPSSISLSVDVLNVAYVGSVAKRQYRVCIDFRIMG